MKIILASQSPRRRELLQALGHELIVIEPKVDELSESSGLTPSDLASKNASMKADVIFKNYGLMGAKFVLGADTIVVFNSKIFGKPICANDAENMLKILSGQTHEVLTAICMIGPAGRKKLDIISSKVTFRDLSSQEIKHYVLTNEGIDKAGGYAVQGAGAALVKSVQGSISNVIGLPIDEVLKNAQELEQTCCPH